MKHLILALTLPLWMLFTGLGMIVAITVVALGMALSLAFAAVAMIVVWPFASWLLAKEIVT